MVCSNNNVNIHELDARMNFMIDVTSTHDTRRRLRAYTVPGSATALEYGLACSKQMVFPVT